MKRTLIICCFIMSASILAAQPKLTADNIDEIVEAMTLEEKATLCVGGNPNLVPGAAGGTRAIERLGIPATVFADGPAGLRINPTRDGVQDTFYCTGFPVGTLLASSWDVDLVKKVTSAIGNEVLEYGVDVLLAPGTNIHRNPLCGRNFEYFSEDPVLSGNMAAAYISGVQSNNVGTSIKHFAANNQETNRNENNAVIGERALREIYLRNFEIAVTKSQPWTVMSSYNKLNGEYTQQSDKLLTSVLRSDWGFDGLVMTDWGSKEATAKAASAGNDLMEPGNQTEIDRLVEAVRSGNIQESELDRNVRNILRYIVRTPRFAGYEYSDKPDLVSHAAIARDAAAQSMVLLRNENNTLPFDGVSRIALYGISSIDFVAGGTGSGNVNKAYVVNMADGLRNAGYKLDEDLVSYYQNYIAFDKVKTEMSRQAGQGWGGFFSSKYAEIEVPATAIKNQAVKDDAAVIVIGRNAGEGSDRSLAGDFELSPVERELIYNVSNAFHQEGKKVVVVLNIGGVIETNSWKNLVDAILLPWSPGQEGANAVGDVLAGKVNPSGKLPMTFPVNYFDHPSSSDFPYDKAGAGDGLMIPRFNSGRGQNRKQKNVDETAYDEGIWVGYRYFDTKSVAVSYPFGFGLSYTTFSYSHPVAKSGKDGITASVTVTNTGTVLGKEIVELYVKAPEGGLEKPEKELKAFAKTALLQPGESQVLTFKISRYELASFNENANRWETASGKYYFFFGASVSDVKATALCRLGSAETFSVAE